MNKNTQRDITLLLIPETYECMQNTFFFFALQLDHVRLEKYWIHYLSGNDENQLFFVQSLTEQIQLCAVAAHT